jgi:hypothetical protein
VLDGDKLIEQRTTGTTSPGRATLPSSDFLLPLPQRQPLDIYLRLVSEHQLRPHITLQPAVMPPPTRTRR